jgi:TPR repeat protein
MYFSRFAVGLGVFAFFLSWFGFKHPELFIYYRRSAILTALVGEKVSTMLGKYVGAPLTFLIAIVMISTGVSREITIQKAQRGDTAAQYELADQFYRGDFQVEDLEQALTWSLRAARSGHPEARTFIDTFRYQGARMARDLEEAFTGYRLLAEAGEPWAQAKVGESYQNGAGVEKDIEKAVRWYQAAARSGDNPARIRLAKMYAQGKDVPEDQARAFAYYLSAAEEGDIIAQGLVGYRCDHGIGTDQNHAAAIQWYTRSGAEGLPSSRINLGILYLKHFRKDSAYVAKARQLFEQAVALDQEACINLGLMALRGVDRPPDRVEAYAWFALAAERGSDLGRRKQDDLTPFMSSAQIEQAEVVRQKLFADYFRPPTAQEKKWMDMAQSGLLEVKQSTGND